MGNENVSHPTILAALGSCMKHLILGMCEINALAHEIITSLRTRNFVTNEVIKFMSNIKLGKSQLNDIFQAGKQFKLTLPLMDFRILMQGIVIEG